MEVDKKKSKGGFLLLFDWHGKSRKKLFANNADLPEGSEQRKETVESDAKSRLHLHSELDESRESSSNKGSIDFNCTSSVASDEGYGAKAPGVVARLMGLDSLPISNVPEARATAVRNSHFHGLSHPEKKMQEVWNVYHPMEYLSAPNKLDSVFWNPAESKVNKVRSKPIERFQTESLPPKSAKSIPSTHHKLLSPISSPGFIPTRDAAYVMEAVAKIIEANPQGTAKKKVSAIGSSSVPLRIRDLKEKLEAADKASKPQTPIYHSAAKCMKGQCNGKSNIVSECTKNSVASGKGNSNNSRKKGKSVSLAVQAKVNVERREGSISSSRSSRNLKKESDNKAKQALRSQPDTQKTFPKGTSLNKTKTVLRQNNQKQNCKDSSTLKSSPPNQGCRQPKSSMNVSSGANRSTNKVVLDSEVTSRKPGSTTTYTDRNLSRRKSSGKKQSASGDPEERISENLLIRSGKKSVKCNVTTDGDMNWSTDSPKKDTDIVSFTFSSPLKRSMPDPQSSGEGIEKDISFGNNFSGDNDIPYSKSSAFFSHGFNVIGSDALSALLEQKLRELTCKVDTSTCHMIREEKSELASEISFPRINGVNTSSSELVERLPHGFDKDLRERLDDSDCISADNQGLDLNQKLPIHQSEGMEEHSSSSINSEARKEFDCQDSSPTSILEPSFSIGSCSDDKNKINGSEQFFLDQQEFSWFPANESQTVEDEAEVSESASSISIGTFSLLESKEPSKWELEYVRRILKHADLMLTEFALGQIRRLLPRSLYYQLENQESTMESNKEEYSKLRRRALFDCVSECLDLMCRQLLSGSFRAWVKCADLFQRKGWLAEELYKEIICWNSMGDLMVDELVEKDMSSRHGRWLDFEREAFEEGVEIENVILTSLVDELVSDLLLF